MGRALLLLMRLNTRRRRHAVTVLPSATSVIIAHRVPRKEACLQVGVFEVRHAYTCLPRLCTLLLAILDINGSVRSLETMISPFLTGSSWVRITAQPSSDCEWIPETASRTRQWEADSLKVQSNR